MSRKLAIIINAHAGENRAALIAREAHRKLWGWPLEFFIGVDVVATRLFISQLNPDVFAAIIVAGGDGTLNQLLPSLLKTNLPIATFPAGTANDLASENGMTGDWEDLQSAIDLNTVKKIDLIEVNGRPFATIGGIGIGASLTHYVNQMRTNHYWFRKLWKLSRSNAYSALAAKKIMLDRDYIHSVRIKTSDFDQSMNISSLLICNQSLLGGDMLITRRSQNDDGKFEMVITSADQRIELIRSLLAAKNGKGLHYNYLIETNACEITSNNGQKIRVFGDGETLAEAESLSFKILPSALTVLAAKKRGGKL